MQSTIRKNLPLAGAGTKGCIARKASSTHDLNECAGDKLASNLIQESCTVIFLPCLTGRDTERENSGPGLQLTSQGHVSLFMK